MTPNDKRTLQKNIEFTIAIILKQVKHLDEAKTRAKSSYYKVIFLLGSSVIEAMVYSIIVQKLGDHAVVETDKYTYYDTHPIPKKFQNEEAGETVICKRVPQTIPLKGAGGRTPDLDFMNKTCIKKGVYGETLSKNVDEIRKKRNGIHLQGIPYVDKKYTQKDFDLIFDTIDELLLKLPKNERKG